MDLPSTLLLLGESFRHRWTMHSKTGDMKNTCTGSQSKAKNNHSTGGPSQLTTLYPHVQSVTLTPLYLAHHHQHQLPVTKCDANGLIKWNLLKATMEVVVSLESLSSCGYYSWMSFLLESVNIHRNKHLNENSL